MGTTRIYKYPVNGNGAVNPIVCRRSRLLDIQLQGNEMMCWIETRDDLPETTTELVAFGTGWPIPTELFTDMRYFKTVQDAAGFVWHFYELLEGSFH